MQMSVHFLQEVLPRFVPENCLMPTFFYWAVQPVVSKCYKYSQKKRVNATKSGSEHKVATDTQKS
jgi:hypothetical protein